MSSLPIPSLPAVSGQTASYLLATDSGTLTSKITLAQVFAAAINGSDLSSMHVYNVAFYGAKGDGTTDDTLAIQAAITAAVADTDQGVVLFPGARYVISNQGATYQGASYMLLVQGNCTLLGLPQNSAGTGGTTLLAPVQNAHGILWVNPNYGAAMQHLDIKYSGVIAPTSNWIGVYCIAGPGLGNLVTFSDCSVSNFSSSFLFDGCGGIDLDRCSAGPWQFTVKPAWDQFGYRVAGEAGGNANAAVLVQCGVSAKIGGADGFVQSSNFASLTTSKCAILSGRYAWWNTNKRTIQNFVRPSAGSTTPSGSVLFANGASQPTNGDTVTITINGHGVVTTASGDTLETLAGKAAAAINADSTSNLLVVAFALGQQVNIISKSTSSYSLSTSSSIAGWGTSISPTYSFTALQNYFANNGTTAGPTFLVDELGVDEFCTASFQLDQGNYVQVNGHQSDSGQTNPYSVQVASTWGNVGLIQFTGCNIQSSSGGYDFAGGSIIQVVGGLISNVSPGDAFKVGAISRLVVSGMNINSIGTNAFEFLSTFAGFATISGVNQAGGARGILINAGCTGHINVAGGQFGTNSTANLVMSSLSGTSPPVNTATVRFTGVEGINPLFVPAQPYLGSPGSATVTNVYGAPMQVFISANGNVSAVNVAGTNILGGTVNMANLPPISPVIAPGQTLSIASTAGTLTTGWFPAN